MMENQNGRKILWYDYFTYGVSHDLKKLNIVVPIVSHLIDTLMLIGKKGSLSMIFLVEGGEPVSTSKKQLMFTTKTVKSVNKRNKKKFLMGSFLGDIFYIM